LHYNYTYWYIKIVDMHNDEPKPKKDTGKRIVNKPEKKLPIVPMTRAEVEESAQKRIAAIQKEFTEGFDFIKNYSKSVTFFGSARFTEENEHYKKARSVAKRIVEELDYTVVTGGGPGVMEAANRGAQEAGGDSIGISIELPHEQATNPYVTDFLEFHYFFTRKVCLTFSAEAYLYFPGGFGTMDEFFEIITLIQTHKIQKVPIILVGNDYWGKLESMIKENLLERDTIDQEDLDLYTITEDEDEIIEIIKKAPVHNGLRYRNHDE